MANPGGALMYYKTPEVAEMIGIPHRTLLRWIESGVVRIHKPPSSRGDRALFSEKDLRELKVLASLREKVSLQKLRRIRAYLRSLGFNPFSGGKFLVVGEGKRVKDVIMICDKEKAFSLLDTPGQLYLIVPLEEEEK